MKLYGIHAVANLIEHHSKLISQLLVQTDVKNPRIKNLLTKTKLNKIVVNQLSRHQLNDLAGTDKHQGIVAVCEDLPKYDDKFLKKYLAEQQDNADLLILILDGIADPHNLGACLRTAEAAGVNLIICPKDNNVGLTEVVHKSACGASLVLPTIMVSNLARTLNLLKDNNIWLYGAVVDQQADTNLYQMDFNGRVGLVMGAEGSGMRRLTKQACDQLFTIPLVGETASLNVSVAAGISLFEVVRQRLLSK